MQTSLYLSNNNILAVVGSGGKKIKVKKLCRMHIQDGSLINGIVTNEAELSEQLKTFWKENGLSRKNVSLVVSSSQFTLKKLSLPVSSEKKIREMIPMEFENASQLTDPIFDYMITESGDRNLTAMQAVMAERSFVKGYVELFDSIGIRVDSISTGRACVFKMLQALPQLRNETCIVMYVDNSSINSTLWSDNQAIHSMANRVFSEPGTEQFGMEIARIINNLLQFVSAQHLESHVSRIYLNGVTDQEFEIYSRSVAEMETGASAARLDMDAIVKLQSGIAESPVDYLACLGNLLKASKDINLVDQAKKKARKKTAPIQWKKYVVWPLICLVVCGGIFGFLTLKNRQKTEELADLQAFLTNPSNIEKSNEVQELEVKLSRIARQISEVETVNENLDSYPLMNSPVVKELEKYAEQKDVTLEVVSYSAADGTLNVDAEALEVRQINHFIDSLQESGLFDDISYTGYTYDEDTRMYTIHVTVYLAENAGK